VIFVSRSCSSWNCAPSDNLILFWFLYLPFFYIVSGVGALQHDLGEKPLDRCHCCIPASCGVPLTWIVRDRVE